MPVKHKSTVFLRTKLNKLMPRLVNGIKDTYHPDYIFKMPCASYKSAPGEFPIEKIIIDPVQHIDVIGGPYDHINSMMETQTFQESPEPTTVSGEKYEAKNFVVHYDTKAKASATREWSWDTSSSEEESSPHDPMLNRILDPAAESNRLQLATGYIDVASEREARWRSIALRGEYQLYDSLANGYYHIE